MSPLSNSYLNAEQINKKESFYPLHVFVCDNCLLVQLEEFESPQNIFTNYAYFSSYSKTWLEHAQEYVNMMITRFGFDEKSQVIEIASNDGYLLQYFKEKKIPILGIEPAVNVGEVAEKKGIPTIFKFFGTETAKELVSLDKKADLLLGNNVLAHVPNLNDFVKGLKILLKPNGVITMEFPHLLKLIQQKQFDTIYHEHFSYFSFLVVQKIFASHQLTIFDVEEIPTHGGSLRVYAKHEENQKFKISENIAKLIKKEHEFGIDKMEVYSNFQKTIELLKQQICKFFSTIKNENKTIVGYGAPAKGNTLLNYCKIGNDVINYTVDKNPYKQGLFLPGTHIPILDLEKIRVTKPDYVLILPWNLKDEIIQQINFIREWGGKFVTVIPEVRIHL
ncbi:C-methyltransferase [Nitrosarchaeum koreense MY1]|uniref:C-methyltransferase n=2 Tax=Nitrosarchaeum TaxID=1007082 RepID=F9CYA0_9ARCH|nr:C-methyltransferase [Nitrosarchaeum koreense MY1]